MVILNRRKGGSLQKAAFRINYKKPVISGYILLAHPLK